MYYTLLYSFFGFLLGWGSPIGAFLLRWYLFFSEWDIRLFFQWEWQQYSFFYHYMTVGSCSAFTLFGFFIGKKQDRLFKEAYTDARTKLANVRRLPLLFEELQSDLRLRGKPLSVLLFDLDRFKSINDRFGHPVGNQILRAFARLLASSIRDGDTAIRYGGEEFLCVLPGCDLEEALAIAERIRKETQNRTWRFDGGSLRMTVSCGVASAVLGKSLSYRRLIDEADKALLYAKQSGRNRTLCAKTSKKVKPSRKRR